MLDATNAWELFITDEQELAGLPESARAAARQAAERDGKSGWKLTLHMPSFLPVMMYADNRELRRQIYEASATRASELGPHAGRWDNSAGMQRILALRAEKAKLLGFPNFAALSIATKMAESTDEVFAFLRDLAARSRPAAQKELAELRAFAAERFGMPGIEAWDIPYYTEKLRQERYDFSEEDLRPYFPEPQVVGGMFDVVRRLYGLDIHDVPKARSFGIRMCTSTRSAMRAARCAAASTWTCTRVRTSAAARGWTTACRASAMLRACRFRSPTSPATSVRRWATSRHCSRTTRSLPCFTSSATACTTCSRWLTIRAWPASTG